MAIVVSVKKEIAKVVLLKCSDEQTFPVEGTRLPGGCDMTTKSAKVDVTVSKPPVKVTVAYTVELLRLADRLHRYYEAACNYGLTATQDVRVTHLEERARAICVVLGIEVKFNGDPRGYPVKLLLPSGDYNTWGGKEEGWGI